MRILYLASRLPFPPIGGHKLRVYYFLKYLSVNHDVTLACILSPYDKGGLQIDLSKDQELVHDRLNIRTIRLNKIEGLFHIVKGVFSRDLPLQLALFNSKKSKKFLEKINNEHFDLIIHHLPRTGQFFKLFRNKESIKVLDIVDSLAVAYQQTFQYSKNLSSMIKRMEISKLVKWEKKNLIQFDKCLVASERDKAYFKDQHKVSNIRVLPNGVDMDYFSYRPSMNPENSVVFVGSYRHQPNRDAVTFFAKEVFPLVLKEVPDLKFKIVGLAPTESINNLASENISIHADVDDVRDFVYSAAVSVCPIRIGTGIQNKILEAMAMGVPVVTSDIGAMGIEGQHQIDFMVSPKNRPHKMANDIIYLIKNKTFRKNMIRNARNLVEKKYSWQSIINDFINDLSLKN